MTSTAYRPEFEAALRLLAQVTEAMQARGVSRPVLSGTAPDRLEQARILLHLHPDAEMDYLNRRIREETGGDYGLEDLQS